MSHPDPSSAAFFEAKYQTASNGDPWHFATARYELQRYNAIIDALDGQRYARCFEPGCSVGVLTERLATVCDAVDACDFSPTAVTIAQQRCTHLPGVTIRCSALSVNVAWSEYSLIVLCEIGYYFTARQWQALVTAMVHSMRPGTVLLASHWLGTSKDHRQSGDAVHAALVHPHLHRTSTQHHEGFRLERWTRR
jgi:2-polyprenyl-3-methyl-5-hydroxy-6-metoxy-1,4-benzoquinol methylase